MSGRTSTQPQQTPQPEEDVSRMSFEDALAELERTWRRPDGEEIDAVS